VITLTVDADPRDSGLILTGERTLPGIEHENYWFRRHEVAYLVLRPFVAGARVLEAGSGEGYGAGLLAGVAESVTALELDPTAAAHSSAAYPDVRTVRGNLCSLPFGDSSFDAIAHFQTFEHLWDQAGFVAECARVLRPGGTLLLTTPNTLTFPKGNPFHVRELTMPELVELLEPHFTIQHRWGLRHAPRLVADDAAHGSLIDAQIATPETDWDTALRERVTAVTDNDFDIGPFHEDDLDLVVVATRTALPDGA
jgi:SAM-dependent methyltransferase